MDNYEDHLDQLEEDAYARKYARRMVETCISGVVDELAEHHGITQQEAIKRRAGEIKKISKSVLSCTAGELLSKKLGADLSMCLENLSHRLDGRIPPQEAKELAWIERTHADPNATDLQLDEAAAVEQAIQDIESIGSVEESPELSELYANGRQAAKTSIQG
ncbi:hypothetical protein DSLASN_00740 [Desulfoluna limicola]|uniref:Uncharacterized protein n=1 Tax=Desulfoluna limicola TaxID=2810562 RepID=A0ABN6EYY8_9BACT|nr:hypothetical protein [Desulfoluna limicola]BCS94442.1 hypothetical protein DSLASN_00740 [Desulfoluna limicola]